MMNMITVDNVFNLINLLVRIGLIVYVVKKYIIEKIVTLIYLEKQDLIYLQDRQNHLAEKQRKVALQIQEDQQVFQTLHEKFKIWDANVQKKLAQDQQSCQKRQDDIFNAVVKRTAYLQKQRLIQAEVPDLLNRVRQDLEQKFAKDPLLSKQFNQKLLQALNCSQNLNRSGLHG